MFENAYEYFEYVIKKKLPESRERSLALTKLEETLMWAKTGIEKENRKNEIPQKTDCD